MHKFLIKNVSNLLILFILDRIKSLQEFVSTYRKVLFDKISTQDCIKKLYSIVYELSMNRFYPTVNNLSFF